MNRKFISIILVMVFFAFAANAQDFGSVNQTNKAEGVSFAKKSTMQTGLRNGKANFIVEAFDTEIPATWTVETEAGAAGSWAWNGGFADIDSDAGGSGTILIAGTLTSPTVDVTTATVLYLAFDHYYYHFGTSYGEVEVFDGTDWQNVATYNATTGDMDHVEIDVTAYVNADFAVRFYYTDNSEWDWYWHVDNVVVFSPEEHDLAVDVVVPTFVILGESATPQVTIHNYGASDEAIYDVQLVIDGAGYDETVNVTTVIAAGADAVIDFPEWTTPAEGTYDITATVTVADDAVAENDEMIVSCSVSGMADAYAGGTGGGIYNEINLPDGALNPVGTIAADPFPMAEEFADGVIYRALNDGGFGTVGADGTFTSLGSLNGFSGTTTGLAYDWENDVMYVMVLDAGNLPNLCILDLGTLALTPVGSASVGMIIAIDFANDGFLYGPSLDDDMLYQIDPATGISTAIGAIGVDLNYGQDVSYDPDDELFYTITCGASYAFGTYDLATGAFTQIADMAGEQYGTFVITKEPYFGPTYTVTFTVDDGTDLLEGAEIAIDGDVLTTDADGYAEILLGDGDYDWEITYGEYCDAYTGTTTVYSPTAIIEIEASLTCYDVYTVTMTILDGDDAPIVGATVVVDDGAAKEVWEAITDGSGIATFDLMNGVYTYTAAADGYITCDPVEFTVADINLDNPPLNLLVGITELNSNISIFPNPSNGQFAITLDGTYSLEIMDITGKVVLSQELTNVENIINLEQSGVYMLRLTNGTQTLNYKVIVE